MAPWTHLPAELLAAWFREFRPNGRRPGDRDAMSMDESFAFVSRGVALYCVPESVSRFYARPDVMFRPIIDVHPVRVAVAWRTDTAHPEVAAFVDVARSVAEERDRAAIDTSRI